MWIGTESMFAEKNSQINGIKIIPHNNMLSYKTTYKINIMKQKTISILLSLYFVLTTFYAHAQQNTVAVGGVATGIGGTASYSIGQIDYITATGVGGTASQGLQQVYRLDVNLKCYIEGYYDYSGLMKPVLNNQGQTNGLSDVDTMTIELHHATFPHATAHSYTGVLKSNGTISCSFPNASEGQNYYVVLKHRNAIETWSANAITLSAAVYDFTTAANKAFGNNQTEVEPTIFALYSGDFNQDENIDLLDVAILEPDINNFLFGYFNTDVNGDGNVDLLDNPILESNVNNFVFSNHP